MERKGKGRGLWMYRIVRKKRLVSVVSDPIRRLRCSASEHCYDIPRTMAPSEKLLLRILIARTCVMSYWLLKRLLFVMKPVKTVMASVSYNYEGARKNQDCPELRLCTQFQKCSSSS
jgi:hypothetical protein